VGEQAAAFECQSVLDRLLGRLAGGVRAPARTSPCLGLYMRLAAGMVASTA
jgi:hypothetical protein